MHHPLLKSVALALVVANCGILCAARGAADPAYATVSGAAARPATPAATSAPATPAATSASATPSAIAHPATPAATSTPATSAATSAPVPPSAMAHPATPAAATAASSSSPERLSHGRFENVAIYRPAGTPKSTVLLLSGHDGWNASAAALAQALSRHGALVVGIDYPRLAANLDADGSDCVFPDGDLENLSHFVQAYYRVPTYLPPFLAGYGDGAALTYGTLAQAPPGTFAGALTAGFCPVTSLRKPLCKGSGVSYAERSTPVTSPPATATRHSRPAQQRGKRAAESAPRPEYLPATTLSSPWVTLQASPDSCSAAPSFLGKTRGAAVVPLSAVRDVSTPDAWMAPFLAAFDVLAARAVASAAPAAPVALGDLPVVEVPAQPGTPPTDTLAVILSGDGGWAGLDKEVADALTARGIPVAGLDSLRYFWAARTPQGLAADLDRMVRYYLAHFGKKRALLIGYSQGADVLPFALNQMPPATLSKVGLAVLMGMSEHALFEFHVSSWVSNDESGPATMPEVNRLVGLPVLCIYGEGDDDSLCPKLDPTKVKVVKLPGGHHFDGDYARLAREILAAAGR